MPSSILDIATFKERFDPLLTRELDRHIERVSSFTDDAECRALLTYIKELALAGGKRIRPYAAYLMYRTAGGNDEAILESLVALEIFHTFALIHDDIIDHGELRHGLPSMHMFAKSFVSGTSEQGTHLAEGLALLAGDLCFSWSRETFIRSGASAEAQTLFDEMVYAVVMGQILDVKMVCQPNPSEAKIMEKTSLKTTEYTFVYPMRIGASLAEKSEEFTDWCKTLGTSLGVAFQVQDDLIDITGTAHATGKKPLQDIAEGQHTIFTAYLRAHASIEDQAEFNAIFGNNTEESAVEALQGLFERSGALVYGKEVIAAELLKAKETITKLGIDTEAYRAWNELIGSMERRTG